jgi:hypothetical protein
MRRRFEPTLEGSLLELRLPPSGAIQPPYLSPTDPAYLPPDNRTPSASPAGDWHPPTPGLC